MSFFTIRDPATGEQQRVGNLDGYDGWEVVCEHDRLPEEYESWVHDQWQVDEARKVDAEAGKKHIADAHLLKQLEAAVILSGVHLDHGLIHEEAQVLGITTLELAQIVHKKTAEFRLKELGRRKVKKGA